MPTKSIMSLRILGIFLVLISCKLLAQDSLKVARAYNAQSSPTIDGRLVEQEWNAAQPIVGFKQNVPYFAANERFTTEVKILYDDFGVYVGATMFDPHPDSILQQLGNRDDEYLNADFFAVEFDTYNTNLDAYSFRVYASGVQLDFTENDETFDAVWRSAVQINEKGWCVEIEIPWSAIRFPVADEQVWSLQLIRGIRRYRESDQWALEPNGVSNDIPYWGHLHGIKRIESPLRLSLTPYIATALEHYPYNLPDVSNFSFNFTGGLDLKYGLNESFTFDATLLPDFTQVKSDNQIKNITAFETIYSEQRPFFKEAVDLFEKNNLFYSRRIGRTPSLYNSVAGKIDSTDKVSSNPMNTKLINAVKFSGRNKSGLAIGVLNAVTDRMCATVETLTKESYEVVTEPFANYNIVVIDQALRNNSSFYLINTNVWREGSNRKANVSGGGFSLMDRTNRYKLSGDGSISQLFTKDLETNLYNGSYGYQFNLNAGKVSGVYQYQVFSNLMNDKYNANDLGITRTNNYWNNGIKLIYNIFEPTQILRNFQASLTINHQINFKTKKPENTTFLFKTQFTNHSYTSFWFNFRMIPFETYDYYEPRTDGWFYLAPANFFTYFGFSTDYRKTFAFDGSLAGLTNSQDLVSFECQLSPIWRVNNHLLFKYILTFENVYNDKGFTERISDGTIIFANRDITGVENSLTGTYNFRNNLSLNLWARYYWYYGIYDAFFKLNNNGYLLQTQAYNGSNGFNFNSFNIDLSFDWEFAPGSNLTLMWKNAIITDEEAGNSSYISNFKNILQSPQLNTLSLKLLYYFDYQYLVKSKRATRQ